MIEIFLYTFCALLIRYKIEYIIILSSIIARIINAIFSCSTEFFFALLDAILLSVHRDIFT